MLAARGLSLLRDDDRVPKMELVAGRDPVGAAKLV